MRFVMQDSFAHSGTIRRETTTIYLRGDLKTTARKACIGAGLPLSRYIEALLVGELAEANLPPTSQSAFPSSLGKPQFPNGALRKQ